MKRAQADEGALRRDALAARASLQRIELASAVAHLGDRTRLARGLGTLALRAVRGSADAPPSSSGASTASASQPWIVSGGWLLWRVLRVSPAARWVVGAAALGGAVWWVARALRTPDEAPDDDSG